jgi:phage shock protein E
MYKKVFTPSTMLSVCLLVGLLFVYLSAKAEFTNPQDVRKLVSEGALLIDVRTPEEYDSKHIEKAINIPVDEVETRLKEFGDPNKPVIVYCRSGKRSARARLILLKHGFTSVYNLGGIGRWPEK